MSAGILIDNQLDVPPGIDTLDDFRHWVRSADFPEQGRIDWVAGKLEIEMAPDNIFWHGSPKSEIAIVVGQQVRIGDLGHTFIDKTRIVLPNADVSAEPDVVFVSHESISSGRVRFVPTVSQKADSFLEIEGPPDLVVEVVSDSSVNKDRQRLFEAYYEGGISEYWLVDARGEQLAFQSYRRGVDGFVHAASNEEGFQRSNILGTSYQFTRQRGRNNLWRYDLSKKS